MEELVKAGILLTGYLAFGAGLAATALRSFLADSDDDPAAVPLCVMVAVAWPAFLALGLLFLAAWPVAAYWKIVVRGRRSPPGGREGLDGPSVVRGPKIAPGARQGPSWGSQRGGEGWRKRASRS